MLTTGNQLRAGRALIGMDQATLAAKARVNVNTIRNMEASGPGPISGRAVNVRAVERALEASGIEFTNGDLPGVKLRRAGSYPE
jgi:ribosome-binding protein aMBF1 (putative translation factor)